MGLPIAEWHGNRRWPGGVRHTKGPASNVEERDIGPKSAKVLFLLTCSISSFAAQFPWCLPGKGKIDWSCGSDAKKAKLAGEKLQESQPVNDADFPSLRAAAQMARGIKPSTVCKSCKLQPWVSHFSIYFYHD